MEVLTKNVSKEEAKKVEALVRKCMRHLKKKEYELDLPNGCADAAVKVLKVKKIPRAPSLAGSSAIIINLGYWQFGNSHHTEYKSFNEDPIIGKIEVSSNDDHLLITVAHEVAHFVQYKYCYRVKRFRQNYSKPHGDCFKTLYRYLRRDLVNPIVKEKKIELENELAKLRAA